MEATAERMAPSRISPALVDPRFLVALAALFINDLWLKPNWPGVVSGKLSDIAGVVVFPVLIGALAQLLGRRPRNGVVVGFVTFWFVGLQLSTQIDGLHESIISSLLPWSVANTMDPTDLLVLPLATVGLRVLQRPQPLRVHPVARRSMLVLGLLACVAESPSEYSTTTGAPVVREDGTIEFRRRSSESSSVMRSTDGGLSFSSVSVDEQMTDEQRNRPWPRLSQVCLPNEPSHCFRFADADGVKIQETKDGGASWQTSWRHPDEFYVGRSGSSSFSNGGLAVTDDGVVMASTGDGPMLRWVQSDGWSPGALELRRRSPSLAAVGIAAAVVALTTLAMRLPHRPGARRLHLWSSLPALALLGLTIEHNSLWIALIILLSPLLLVSWVSGILTFTSTRFRLRDVRGWRTFWPFALPVGVALAWLGVSLVETWHVWIALASCVVVAAVAPNEKVGQLGIGDLRHTEPPAITSRTTGSLVVRDESIAVSFAMAKSGWPEISDAVEISTTQVITSVLSHKHLRGDAGFRLDVPNTEVVRWLPQTPRASAVHLVILTPVRPQKFEAGRLNRWSRACRSSSDERR